MPATERRKLLQKGQISVDDHKKSRGRQSQDGQVTAGDCRCYGITRGRGQATLPAMVVPLRRRRNVEGWVEEKHSHEDRMKPELEISNSEVDLDVKRLHVWVQW